MENIILEFDKRKVSTDEIIEHIDYYLDKSNEAMSLKSSGDIKGARVIFKDLRSKLQLEKKYYEKDAVQKHIIGNNIYVNYASEIRNALVKQTNPNSNDMLSSNLYDIYSYMSYCKTVINNFIEKEL